MSGRSSGDGRARNVRIGIVGAGFDGLGMGARLEQRRSALMLTGT